MRGIRILLSFDFYLHTDHLNQPTQRYWPSICFTLYSSFILRRQRAEFAALALPPMVRYNRRSRSTGSAELINPVGEFVRHPIPWAVPMGSSSSCGDGRNDRFIAPGRANDPGTTGAPGHQ